MTLIYIEDAETSSGEVLISDCHKHFEKQLNVQLMIVAEKLPMMWKVRMSKKERNLSTMTQEQLRVFRLLSTQIENEQSAMCSLDALEGFG
ncbi:hypothetical protein ElyMa_004012900 [Elysia marginata]|uniref:Uncharacterized protein n=1 Tax=Elysia marginata TaxID=1093978 RepID=A0AAV4G1R0_9GAST|nr:hypothetical protein ElyMa_004012900 [Elysia marginata]